MVMKYSSNERLVYKRGGAKAEKMSNQEQNDHHGCLVYAFLVGNNSTNKLVKTVPTHFSN